RCFRGFFMRRVRDSFERCLRGDRRARGGGNLKRCEPAGEKRLFLPLAGEATPPPPRRRGGRRRASATPASERFAAVKRRGPPARPARLLRSLCPKTRRARGIDAQRRGREIRAIQSRDCKTQPRRRVSFRRLKSVRRVFSASRAALFRVC